jgi:hypothetical protein
MDSDAGAILSRAAALESAIACGFAVTLGDITVEEFQALEAIGEERARIQKHSG